MATPTLQFKRGLFVNLPSLRAGEPGFTTDKTDLFIGGPDGNKFFGSHRYWVREDATNAAEFKFVDKDGTNGVSLRSPATVNTPVTYTLPEGGGTSGHYLRLGSAGVLEWASVSDGASFDNATLSNTTFTGISTFSGAIDANEGLDVSGHTELDDLNVSGVGTIATADINGGNIDNTVIGGSTPAAGTFTHLEYGTSSTTGISTVGELYVGTTQVLYEADSLITLAGIQTIDAVTKETLERIIALDPNDFDSLNVAGIATVGGLLDANGGLDVSGHTKIGETLEVVGVSTFTGAINAEGGVVGNLTGLASTATALQNARDFSVSGDVATSSAVSFDGTGDVDLIVTLSNTFSANTSGIITATGGFVGNLTGDVTGTASTATRATTVDTTATSDDVSYYVPFVANSGSTTSEIVRVDAGISYNPSTNTLDVANIETTAIRHENGTNSITIDSLGNVGLSTNLTVEGNLTIKGQTTTVNTETLLIKDPVIEVGMEDDNGTLVPPTTNSTTDVGTVLHYYNDGSAKKASFFWDREDNRVAIASSVTVSDNDITVQNWGTLEIGSLLMNGGLTVNDCAGSSVVISCTGTERFLENITVDAGEF